MLTQLTGRSQVRSSSNILAELTSTNCNRRKLVPVNQGRKQQCLSTRAGYRIKDTGYQIQVTGSGYRIQEFFKRNYLIWYTRSAKILSFVLPLNFSRNPLELRSKYFLWGKQGTLFSFQGTLVLELISPSFKGPGETNVPI